MPIGKHNIAAFIKHLYQTRHHTLPGDDILKSWSALSDAEIQQHLAEMTANWGWTSDRLQSEVNQFLKPVPAPNKVTVAPPIVPDVPPVQQVERIKTSSRSKGKVWLIVLLVILGGGGLYGFITYHKFNNLPRLYSTTDNITIRNSKGVSVGRMDVFEKSNSILSLRVVDDKVYNIAAENDTKISECRKLLLDDATFSDYLFGNEKKTVYVNKSFLTTNKDYGRLQKNVFAELYRYPNELAQIRSDMRKVIIGSLEMNPGLSSLFVRNSCGNSSGSFTSIIKHKLKDGETISIICKLSDNKYYKFTGNPDKDSYMPPQVMQFKNPTDGGMTDMQGADLLFKLNNGQYQVFTCGKEYTGAYSEFDDRGDITYFSVIIPTQNGHSYRHDYSHAGGRSADRRIGGYLNSDLKSIFV